MPVATCEPVAKQFDKVTLLAVVPEVYVRLFHRRANEQGVPEGKLLQTFIDWGIGRFRSEQPDPCELPGPSGSLVCRVSAECLLSLVEARNERFEETFCDLLGIVVFDPWQAMPGLSETLTDYFSWGWREFERQARL